MSETNKNLCGRIDRALRAGRRVTIDGRRVLNVAAVRSVVKVQPLNVRDGAPESYVSTITGERVFYKDLKPDVEYISVKIRTAAGWLFVVFYDAPEWVDVDCSGLVIGEIDNEVASPFGAAPRWGV